MMSKSRTPTPKRNALAAMEAILEEDPLLEQVQTCLESAAASGHADLVASGPPVIVTKDVVDRKAPVSILARKLAVTETSPHPQQHHHVHFYLPEQSGRSGHSGRRLQQRGRELFPDHGRQHLYPTVTIRNEYFRNDHSSRFGHSLHERSFDSTISDHDDHPNKSDHVVRNDLNNDPLFKTNNCDRSNVFGSSMDRIQKLDQAWTNACGRVTKLDQAWNAGGRVLAKSHKSYGNLTKYDHHDPPSHIDHLTTHKTKSGQQFLTHGSWSVPSRKGPHRKFRQLDHSMTTPDHRPTTRPPKLCRSYSDTWFENRPLHDEEYDNYSIAHRSEESLPELKCLQGLQNLNWRLEPKMRALSTPTKDLKKLLKTKSGPNAAMSEITPLIKTYDPDAIVRGLVETNYEANLKKDQWKLSQLTAAILAFAMSILVVVLLCKYVFISDQVQEDPNTYDNWFVLSGCFIGVIIFCYIMTFCTNRADLKILRRERI